MIRIESLTKYFHRGSVNEVLAIEDIDLNVTQGDFITVIGSNGAGKSTLLNCLAGSVSINIGRLWIDEKDVTKWPEHRRAGLMGRVFQDPLSGTCATLSVEQNMALAKKRGAVRGFSLGVKRADRNHFKEQLKILDLGLENRLNDKVGLLSGGQRQALAMGNRLIMLHQGRIIFDVDGGEKKALTVQDLLDRFYTLKDGAFAPDRALLV